MKSHTSLSFLKIASGRPLMRPTFLPKKINTELTELFVENFIEKHAKINAGVSSNDSIRYLNNQVFAIQKLKKMVSLYETLETDLKNKGVNFSVVKTITQQEQNIISLIAEGFQTKEIANKLFISEYTVQTHRKNIYKKLNVTSVTDLVKISMLFTIN